jgi:hypothetical protein
MSSFTPAVSAAAAIWWETQSGVPRPRVSRIVGEQVRVISQPGADRGQRGAGLIQIGRDQRASVRVDGE